MHFLAERERSMHKTIGASWSVARLTCCPGQCTWRTRTHLSVIRSFHSRRLGVLVGPHTPLWSNFPQLRVVAILVKLPPAEGCAVCSNTSCHFSTSCDAEYGTARRQLLDHPRQQLFNFIISSVAHARPLPTVKGSVETTDVQSGSSSRLWLEGICMLDGRLAGTMNMGMVFPKTTRRLGGSTPWPRSMEAQASLPPTI